MITPLMKKEPRGIDPHCFIDGRIVVLKDKTGFSTENPATGEHLFDWPDAGLEEIDLAVAAARSAFEKNWREMHPHSRKKRLLAFADEIEKSQDELAILITLEMGKPISDARGEVAASAEFLRYYAEWCDKVSGTLAPSHPASGIAYTMLEPRGVIGAIIPWNFPVMTAICCLAPALAAGNTIVIKPSEVSPSSALWLAQIGQKAGVPNGVINVVAGRGETAGAALAKHNGVDKLHFTGSTEVGKKLMTFAGESNGKPVMLETGGKSPQIVFEDALDIPNLGEGIARAAFSNSGQICVARTRLLVQRSAMRAVIDQIKSGSRVFSAGATLDNSTTYGPICNRVQFEKVKYYIDLGHKEGAQLVDDLGQNMAQPEGYFIPPTLIENVPNSARVCQEEIFGPVLTVTPFDTAAEALELANETKYGLAATLWTTKINAGLQFAANCDAGRIDIRSSIEGGAALQDFSAEPFKASGHGALGGVNGMLPYLIQKGVQILA